MTRDYAKKIEALFDEGYSISIGGHGFVDGLVDAVFELEEGDDECVQDKGMIGEIVYSSDVFSHRPLSEVSPHNVKVFREVTAETLFNDGCAKAF